MFLFASIIKIDSNFQNLFELGQTGERAVIKQSNLIQIQTKKKQQIESELFRTFNLQFNKRFDDCFIAKYFFGSFGQHGPELHGGVLYSNDLYSINHLHIWSAA